MQSETMGEMIAYKINPAKMLKTQKRTIPRPKPSRYHNANLDFDSLVVLMSIRMYAIPGKMLARPRQAIPNVYHCGLPK